MRRIDLHSPAGVRYLPANPCGTGILVLGGSSGRIEESRAQLLASRGAIAESIRWIGRGPWEVPIELFQSRVADLRRLSDRVVLMGTSFGAEAALVTAAHTPLVETVIAVAPSDVVWAGVREDGTQTSHWTRGGRPLPFIAFDEQWQPDTDPPSFRGLYELSWQRAANVTEATIATERIPEVVLITGGDDQVWPSEQHARRIIERRRAADLPTIHIHHAEAGHQMTLPGEDVPVPGQRMARGGSLRANEELGALAWPRILEAARLA